MSELQSNLSILFVDVSDSVRLYEALGDAAAFREVHDYLNVFKDVVVEYKGRVVKTIGDGALCAFPDADSAVLAACEMQGRVQEKQSVQDRKIAIRIGLHHGPVLLTDDDVFGDTVNTAARMAQLAVAGQIISTAETIERLSVQQRNATRRLDALAVKGKHDAVTVFEVLWQTGSDHTQMPGRMDTVMHQAGVSRLRLMHAGKEIVVVTSITIGRHATHGVPLKDPMASRNHANIERRKDKFVLIDLSSNGTFVSMKTGDEFKLRREEMLLHGSGAIAFGHSPRDRDAEVVGFWCESSGDGKE
ncbi:MAG: FHA domain-containing protein [Betaproteobacteria bacterium]|nr:FHA domain-containing protein [Betaproteobacteria bacterium]